MKFGLGVLFSFLVTQSVFAAREVVLKRGPVCTRDLVCRTATSSPMQIPGYYFNFADEAGHIIAGVFVRGESRVGNPIICLYNSERLCDRKFNISNDYAFKLESWSRQLSRPRKRYHVVFKFDRPGLKLEIAPPIEVDGDILP